MADPRAARSGLVAVVLGTLLVYFLFSRKVEEERMPAQDATEDAAADAGP